MKKTIKVPRKAMRTDLDRNEDGSWDSILLMMMRVACRWMNVKLKLFINWRRG